MRWVDRSFRLDISAELFPEVIERLRGTPGRIEERVAGLAPEVLTRRDGDKWSIQEHVGHLLDLDELHAGRLDDYRAGAEVVRAADITNRKTTEANHNRRPMTELTRAFRQERMRFVERLEQWDPQRREQSALHPRLKQPMRVIDMAWFVAEHDDHHLARMTELARKFSAPSQ
jgi:uncharacterized damage-inducible protein DinB